MIEDTQRQLGDTIKDFTTEVKDVVVALRLEMSELATIVKVMMMVMGNTSQEGGASKRHGKAKVLDPRPYVGEWDTWKLENFLFDMERYFLTSSIDLEESWLNRVTIFLTNATKV